MHIQLPVDIMNNVMKYLATKPFGEVAEIIKQIHEAARTIEDATDPKSEPEQQG